MPVGSTSQRSVQELGFASIGLLTPLRRLYPLPVRQASVLPSASSRFRLATDTLAVRLTLPLAGCVEDFHLQVNAPCRAQQKKRGAPTGGCAFVFQPACGRLGFRPTAARLRVGDVDRDVLSPAGTARSVVVGIAGVV